MASNYARPIPSKPVRYKYLSTIFLGGNEIRFMAVNVQNNAVHFPTSVQNCSGRLLFLASDVLNGTSVAKKNHIRVHTRYAKDGLATKLRLSGFKIEGINNSGTMWFYSIQGLFHVAFELHSLATQKDCLTDLQNIWLDRYTDPPLKPDGVVRYNRRLKTESDAPDVPPPGHTVILQDEEIPRMQVTCPSKVVVLTDDTDPMADPLKYLTIATDLFTPEILEKAEPEAGAGDFVEQLITFVRSSISDVGEIPHQIICQILLTLDFVKHISSKDKDHFFEWGFAFFDMMERYLALAKRDTTDGTFDNTFGLSREKYILLYVIGEWLGLELHSLESQVTLKVEAFKKENLTTIDSLPPSEATIDMLFPSCMKQLLVNWLGGMDEEKSSLDWLTAAAFADHNYSPAIKVRRTGTSETDRPLFPLVQLILEFATNSLVSGVAHVVYSRLRHTT